MEVHPPCHRVKGEVDDLRTVEPTPCIRFPIKEHPPSTGRDESAVDRLEHTVAHLLSFVEGLSEDQRRRSTYDWGVWEVLAYIVGWYECLVSNLTALSNRRMSTYPEGTFAKINAPAIDLMAGVSTQTLCERLATAQECL